eukprot:Em0013g367a
MWSQCASILLLLTPVAEQMDNTLIICRIYACIADMLGYMAGEGGGIRAGPAANLSWQTAFQLLERGTTQLLQSFGCGKGQLDNRVLLGFSGQEPHHKSLASLREGGSDLDQERGGYSQSLQLSALPVTFQRWPVGHIRRLDGHSSPVLRVGVVWWSPWLDSRWRVPYQVCCSEDPRVSSTSCRRVGGARGGSHREGSDAQTVECTTLSQRSDYSQPHAPAALLKAAFICAKIVEFPSSLSLEEQLSSKYGWGFMLQAISNLPQGSATPPEFLDKLSDHLLLVYTGKTRLARNLLQDVLRNWHSRDHRIVQNMTDLVNTAMEAAQAVEQGDLARMGKCMTSYQQQKLCMAQVFYCGKCFGCPGYTELSVFAVVRVNAQSGCCFAGAGGGGFLLAIMKDPKEKPHIKKTVEATPVSGQKKGGGVWGEGRYGEESVVAKGDGRSLSNVG